MLTFLTVCFWEKGCAPYKENPTRTKRPFAWGIKGVGVWAMHPNVSDREFLECYRYWYEESRAAICVHHRTKLHHTEVYPLLLELGSPYLKYPLSSTSIWWCKVAGSFIQYPQVHTFLPSLLKKICIFSTNSHIIDSQFILADECYTHETYGTREVIQTTIVCIFSTS